MEMSYVQLQIEPSMSICKPQPFCRGKYCKANLKHSFQILESPYHSELKFSSQAAAVATPVAAAVAAAAVELLLDKHQEPMPPAGTKGRLLTPAEQ
eukprot:scaffold33749_cov18-Tisochrysis_lutea.AAC.1